MNEPLKGKREDGRYGNLVVDVENIRYAVEWLKERDFAISTKGTTKCGKCQVDTLLSDPRGTCLDCTIDRAFNCWDDDDD